MQPWRTPKFEARADPRLCGNRICGEILLASIQSEYKQRLTDKEFRKPTMNKKKYSEKSLRTLPENWCWSELDQIFYPISVPNSKKLPSKQIKPNGAHPVVDQSLDFISMAWVGSIDIAIP